MGSIKYESQEKHVTGMIASRGLREFRELLEKFEAEESGKISITISISSDCNKREIGFDVANLSEIMEILRMTDAAE